MRIVKKAVGLLIVCGLINSSDIAAINYHPEQKVPVNTFMEDIKLEFNVSKLSPEDYYQPSQGIDMTIDGNKETLYHSPWSGQAANGPVIFEYQLVNQKHCQLDYLVLHPRSTGANGLIKTAKISVESYVDEEIKIEQTIELQQVMQPFVYVLNQSVVQPSVVRIEILDVWPSKGGKQHISLAEVECFQRGDNLFKKDTGYFTDPTYSELKNGVTERKVMKIKNPVLKDIASKLYHKQYEMEFRVQEYKAYRPVKDLARELKTSTYSQFENMTGIHFSQAEKMVVFVGPTHGQKLKLRVKDFGKSGDDYTYPLFEGVNIITSKGKGNGYIDYFTPEYQQAQPVKVHIYGGRINGVFNPLKHTEQDGQRMLDNAVSEVLDICGNKTQLIYDVEGLKKQAYGRLHELIGLYDSIISHQQMIMGLEQYNRLPDNHMLGRVVWRGYMHADGFGAAFSYKTMHKVANPDNIRRNCWGIAHEFGHVNQVRKGMKWVGTSECTNNIFSAWSQYVFNPHSLRLEHEKINGFVGGRYNAYFNNGLLRHQEWGLQCGPDTKKYQPNEKGQWGGDHFVKLVPLWQLHLYYHIAGEGNNWHHSYFWADIFEKVRLTDETNISEGQFQMNFVMNACDAVQQDLTEFFMKAGFLTPVDKLFGDYNSRQKTITQDMVDATILYAQKYPKPQSDVIYYISGNSIDAFQHQLSVEGQYNKGITGDTLKEISHQVWKNVTVFETYHNDELVCITMVGTGDRANTKTLVPYRKGATRIEAVAWDGARTLVFGNR